MFRQTIWVQTYPTEQDYGRDVPNYDAEPEEVEVAGVDVQPGASTELIAQRSNATAVRFTVIVPAAVWPGGITEGSIVRVPSGEICQVDGRPMAWLDGSPLDSYVLILTDWEIPT